MVCTDNNILGIVGSRLVDWFGAEVFSLAIHDIVLQRFSFISRDYFITLFPPF